MIKNNYNQESAHILWDLLINRTDYKTHHNTYSCQGDIEPISIDSFIKESDANRDYKV